MEIAINFVKVITGSFIYALEYFSHQCFTPSFVEISLLVSEKPIFKEFFPYMGMAAILVM